MSLEALGRVEGPRDGSRGRAGLEALAAGRRDRRGLEVERQVRLA
jgi:hypothetical protein